MHQPPYAALTAYAAVARPRTEVWRILVTFGLTAIAYVILTQTALTLLGKALGPFWALAIERAMQGGRTPLGVIAVLASFLPLAAALALAVRLLHDRSWITLLGPWGQVRRTALATCGALLALQALMLPVQVLGPDVGRHLTLAQQAPWLVPAILGILVQATTEEALFRGYLMQQIAARTSNPLAWMVLPAALFALLHYDPSASDADQLWTCGTAFLFGLIAADLTARSGSLGPAIGLHVATNLSAILGLGLYGKMDGLAAWNLVLNPLRPWDSLPYMATDVAGMIVAWLLARVILRR